MQKRAAQTITALIHNPYEARVKRSGLFRLEKRWLRGDMMEEYKIMRNAEKAARGKWVSPFPRTLGGGGELPTGISQCIQKEVRLYSTQNDLPQEVAMATSTDGLKGDRPISWK